MGVAFFNGQARRRHAAGVLGKYIGAKHETELNFGDVIAFDGGKQPFGQRGKISVGGDGDRHEPGTNNDRDHQRKQIFLGYPIRSSLQN